MGLIAREVCAGVPQANIVLGGLSQGCAAALICLLALDGPVGAFVGMSGWLPLRRDMEGLLEAGKEKKEAEEESPFFDEDPFATSDGNVARDSTVEVFEYVTDLLGLDPEGQGRSRAQSALSTPVFLGHGEADDKVKPSLGEEARHTMEAVGFAVEWRIYKGQGHWYKVPDEIDDIVEFVRAKVGPRGGNGSDTA